MSDNSKESKYNTNTRLMVSFNDYEEQKGYLHSASINEDQQINPPLPIPIPNNHFDFPTPPDTFALRNRIQHSNYNKQITNKSLIIANQQPFYLSNPKSLQQSNKFFNVYQHLMIYFYQKYFITKLLKSVSRPKQMTSFQLQLINPNLHDNQAEDKKENPFYSIEIKKQNQNKQFWRRISRRISFRTANLLTTIGVSKFWNSFWNKCESFPLIQPESCFKIIWDSLMTAIRLYFIFIIPIQLVQSQTYISIIQGFHNDIFQETVESQNIVFILCLFLDILVNLNTSIYDTGQKVTSRRQIYQNYAQSFFLQDLISYLVLLVFIANQNNKVQTNLNYTIFYQRQLSEILLLFFFVQLNNIAKMFKKLEETFTLNRTLVSLIDLIKLLAIVLFVEHLFSCLWYFVGEMEHLNGQESWLEKNGLVDTPFLHKYLNSFYFATVTMVSVGYGDICPISILRSQQSFYIADLEKLLCIIFMFLSSVQLSYSVNSVGNIIQDLTTADTVIKRKLRAINLYMQEKKISYQLQFQQYQSFIMCQFFYRIRQYLSFLLEQQQKQEIEVQKALIDQLSIPLKEKLLIESNNIVLKDCPLFKNHFSNQFKKRIIGIIKEVTVSPGQIINSDKELYFIEMGTVQEILDCQNGLVLQTLKQSDYFDLVSFLKDTKSTFRYKSVGFTKLLKIVIDDFLGLLKEFPDDQEVYCQLKDKSQYQENLSFLEIKCQACKNSHQIQNCPIVNYIPDKEKIIKKFTYPHIQERLYKRRRNEKSELKTILQQEPLQEIADLFQQANQEAITELYVEQQSISASSEEDNSSDSESNMQSSRLNTNFKKSIPSFQLPSKQQRHSLLKQRDSVFALGIRQSRQEPQNFLPRKSILAPIKEKGFVENSAQVYGLIKCDHRRQSQLQSLKFYSDTIQEKTQLNIHDQLTSLQNNYNQTRTSDQEMISLALLKMKMQIGENGLHNFESKQKFKIFHSQYNYDNVLQQLNKNSTDQIPYSYYQRSMLYLLYPNQYFMQFRSRKIRKTQARQTQKTRQKTRIYKSANQILPIG